MLNPHYVSTTIQSNDNTFFFINTNKRWQNNASEAKQKGTLACHSREKFGK